MPDLPTAHATPVTPIAPGSPGSDVSHPRSHVFGRSDAALPVAVRGEDCRIFDRSGRSWLDACGGAAVSCLGHSNAAVIEAMARQGSQLAWAHTGFFTSEPAEALADALIKRAPAGITRAYFVSGGSEAVEASLKLVRQYHLEAGEPERTQIIARWQSYHGNTIGALSAGGNRARRGLFEPLLSDAMHHIAPCHYWRHALEGESAQDYARRSADALETKILEIGPGRVAAFIAEPVVGATLGAVPAVADYFRRIRDICNRHGVLLILDEVMCGMGRTGTLFASEQEQITPDIVCIAKGLGAGYQAIGAMLCTETIYDTIARGSGAFQHGHTYLAHPVACAAGLAVLDEIDRLSLLEAVNARASQLHTALHQRFGAHPHVGEIRGRGLFMAIEFVTDRLGNAPFDPRLRLHARIKQAAMANGLMVYPMGGCIDGASGDHVLLAPPYIVTPDEIDEIVSRLGLAVELALVA